MSWQLPVFLNNFNCLQSLQGMVAYLQKLPEVARVHIVDNGSTYPPLLDWYQTAHGCVLHRLERNLHHRAPWTSGVVTSHTKGYDNYVVSDTDLDLSGIPHDFLQVLRAGLLKFPRRSKAGPALRIDDLPDAFPLKQEVVEWERQWWHPLDSQFYDAAIDTTFALYRTQQRPRVGGKHPDLRAAAPYVARHLPWYLTPATITEEDKFRLNLCTGGHWSPKMKAVFGDLCPSV